MPVGGLHLLRRERKSRCLDDTSEPVHLPSLLWTRNPNYKLNDAYHNFLKYHLSSNRINLSLHIAGCYNFFNKTVLISVLYPVPCLSLDECSTLFFISLYFKCYPLQLLAQNSATSLNFRVSCWGVWCTAESKVVHIPQSQLDFRKCNIMRILYRNNIARSSLNVST